MKHILEGPVELLQGIALLSSTKEQHALVLTCRHLAGICTPILYRNITIKNNADVARCIRTLFMESEPYNLAALIRSISLETVDYGISFPQSEWVSVAKGAHVLPFARQLTTAVSRMAGLQQFAYSSNYPVSMSIFSAVSHASSSTLRSLKLQAPYLESVQSNDPDTPVFPQVPADSSFPQLKSLALMVSKNTSQPWFDYFRSVLQGCAGQLHNLDIRHWEVGTPPEWMATLFKSPQATVWRHLQMLEISQICLSYIGRSGTPDVRALVIMPNFTLPDIPMIIPPEAFPNLRALTCPHNLLSGFLPETMAGHTVRHKTRPIREVALTEAVLSLAPFHIHWDFPTWQELRQPLSCLEHSAGPVAILDLNIDWLRPQDLKEEELGYLDTLEKLAIRVHGSDSEFLLLQAFGRLVLSRAPRLHTFTFLGPDTQYDSMDDSNDIPEPDLAQERELLKGWDVYNGSLREVSISPACVWRKMGSGWQISQGETPAKLVERKRYSTFD
ncbi:hypothetical protein BD413DRAFT_615103 [Trametes elegans]|nr:hypothetical protein BD413DRAFT_615103 [Trametes elegans]